MEEWGVADPARRARRRGEPERPSPAAQVYLLQRKATGVGKGWARPPAGSIARRSRRSASR
jgi:hypothetical protein